MRDPARRMAVRTRKEPRMSQRNVQKLEKPAVQRTLRRFWEVTRMKPGAAFLAVFTSIAYVALLI